MRRVLLTVLVLALIVATTAAFVVTEALKLERSPVTRPRFDRVFSPTCACPRGTARLALRLREADTIDAEIVDAEGSSVRTLLSDSRREAGRLVFRWNGRNDAGAVVPDGPYRLRVRLGDQRRTITIPNVVRADTQPPTIELEGLSPISLSPDGDGRRDRARIGFRLSERSRPLVLVDGAVAARGKVSPAGAGALLWPGTADGRPLASGTHVVALRVRDRAGNLSPPTEGTAVRIRYVELAQATVRVRRGGVLRFRVLTDARQFRWALVRREGARPLLARTASPGAVAVRLPARVRAGRYVLRVAANGHADDAAVVVRPRR